jgi:hypothetical protein
MEYIRQLQERNRLKKAQSGKSEAQLQFEELERGFVTTFSGAHNQKREQDQAAGAKSAGKPAVIRSNRSAGVDLAKRLGIVDNNKNNKNDKYITKYPGGRGDGQKQDADYQPDLDYIDEEEDYNSQYRVMEDNHGDNSATNTPRIDLPSETLSNPQPLPDPSLLTNISALSKEQKLVLLQLLQDSVQSDVSPLPAISTVSITGPMGQKAENISEEQTKKEELGKEFVESEAGAKHAGMYTKTYCMFVCFISSWRMLLIACSRMFYTHMIELF